MRSSFGVCKGAGILVLLLTFGCCNHAPQGGVIYLGQPQVLSRESIVPERQREAQWLLEELDKTPEVTSFQGMSDALVRQAFTARLTQATLDLAGRARQEESAKLELERLEAERSRLQLLRQIEEAELRNRLQKVINEGTVGSNPPPVPAADQAKLAEIQKRLEDANTKLAAIEAKLKPAAAGQDALGTLADEKARTTGAALAAPESLQDRMAYRAHVNAARRDKMLDETHDLMGRTLYEMKFCVTMVPPEGATRFGFVRVRMPQEMQSFRINGDPNWLNDRVYNQFVRALVNQIHYEYVLIENELKVGHPNAEFDRFWNTTASKTSDSRADSHKAAAQTTLPISVMANAYAFLKNTATKEMQRVAPPYDGDGALQREDGSDGSSLATIRKAGEPETASHGLDEPTANQIKAFLDDKYSVLRDLFKIAVYPRDGRYYLSIDANRPDTAKKENVKRLIKGNLAQLDKATVTSVEPREYAQNISRLAGRENMLELGATLSAFLQGATLGGSIDYLKNTRALAEAIQRQPLALGFADGNDAFGWILGPKYQINEEKKRQTTSFTHVPVVHPLTASIVVPAWAERLTLDVEYGWITPAGDEQKIGCNKQLIVSLTPDADGLVQAFMDTTYQIDRKPRVLPGNFTLQQGERNQRLLIRGLHLWRNPEVYVGHVRAGSVEVLPHMYGLYAYFDEPLACRPGKASLTVATNTGDCHMKDLVTILAPPTDRPQAFASLVAPFEKWLEKEKEHPLAVALKLDPGRQPPLLPQFYAYAYRAGQSAEHMSAPVERIGDSLTVAIPTKLRADDARAVYALSVDVRVRRGTDDMFGTSVLQEPGAFIVFNNEDDTYLHIKAARPAADKPPELVFAKPNEAGKSITIELPRFDKPEYKALFYQAYPGLLNAKSLRLMAGPTDELRPIEGKADLEQGTMEFLIPPPRQPGSQDVDLVVSYGPGERDYVPVRPKLKLTLTETGG